MRTQSFADKLHGALENFLSRGAPSGLEEFLTSDFYRNLPSVPPTRFGEVGLYALRRVADLLALLSKGSYFEAWWQFLDLYGVLNKWKWTGLYNGDFLRLGAKISRGAGLPEEAQVLEAQYVEYKARYLDSLPAQLLDAVSYVLSNPESLGSIEALLPEEAERMDKTQAHETGDRERAFSESRAPCLWVQKFEDLLGALFPRAWQPAPEYLTANVPPPIAEMHAPPLEGWGYDERYIVIARGGASSGRFNLEVAFTPRAPLAPLRVEVACGTHVLFEQTDAFGRARLGDVACTKDLCPNATWSIRLEISIPGSEHSTSGQ